MMVGSTFSAAQGVHRARVSARLQPVLLGAEPEKVRKDAGVVIAERLANARRGTEAKVRRRALIFWSWRWRGGGEDEDSRQGRKLANRTVDPMKGS